MGLDSCMQLVKHKHDWVFRNLHNLWFVLWNESSSSIFWWNSCSNFFQIL